MKYGFDYLTSGNYAGDWQQITFLVNTVATITTTKGDTLTDVSFTEGHTIVGAYAEINVTSGGLLAYKRRNVTKRSLTDADFQAVLNKGTAEGYSLPTGTALTAGDTLVRDLKSAGVWDKLDLFYVFATNGDSDFATLNWKAPASFQATKVNAPTFTSLEGFTGNGSSSYLNLNWNPFSDGVNYALGSASYGVYVRTDSALTSNETEIGATEGATNPSFMRSRNSGSMASLVNSGNAVSTAVSTSAGFNVAIENGSSLFNYKNGSQIGTQGTPNFGASATNRTFTVLARGNASPDLFSPRQVSIAYAGADLSTEASDFYTAIQNYMTAIGKEV